MAKSISFVYANRLLFFPEIPQDFPVSYVKREMVLWVKWKCRFKAPHQMHNTSSILTVRFASSRNTTFIFTCCETLTNILS